MNGFKNLLKNLMIAMLVVGLVVGPNSMVSLSNSTTDKAKADFPREYLSDAALKFQNVKYGIEQNDKDVTGGEIDSNTKFVLHLRFDAKVGGKGNIQDGSKGTIKIFENINIKDKEAWKNRKIPGAFHKENNKPLDIGTMSVENSGADTVINFDFHNPKKSDSEDGTTTDGENSEENVTYNVFDTTKDVVVEIDITVSKEDFNELVKDQIFKIIGKEYIFTDNLRPNTPYSANTSYTQDLKTNMWKWEIKYANEFGKLDGLSVTTKLGLYLYKNSYNSWINAQNKPVLEELQGKFLGNFIENSFKIKNETTGELVAVKPSDIKINLSEKEFTYTFPSGAGKSHTLIFDVSIANDPGHKVHKNRYNKDKSPKSEDSLDNYNIYMELKNGDKTLPLHIYEGTKKTYREDGYAILKLKGANWINLPKYSENAYMYEGIKNQYSFYISANNEGLSATDLEVSYVLPKFLNAEKVELVGKITADKYQFKEDLTSQITRIENSTDGTVEYKYKKSGTINETLYLKVYVGFDNDIQKLGTYNIRVKAKANETKSEVEQTQFDQLPDTVKQNMNISVQDYYEYSRVLNLKEGYYRKEISKDGFLAKHKAGVDWKVTISGNENEPGGLSKYKFYDLFLYGEDLNESNSSFSFSNNPGERPEMANENNKNKIELWNELLFKNSDPIVSTGQRLVQASLNESLNKYGLSYKVYPVFQSEREVGELLEISGFPEATLKTKANGDKLAVYVDTNDLKYVLNYQTELVNPELRKTKEKVKALNAKIPIRNGAHLYKEGKRGASYDCSVIPHYLMDKHLIKSQYVSEFLNDPSQVKSYMYTDLTRSKGITSSYSYGDKAMLIAIELLANDANEDYKPHKEFKEYVGEISFTEKLPKGWKFEKISEDKPYLVFDPKNNNGVRAIKTDHADFLTQEGDFIGHDEVKFNYNKNQPDFKKMMVVLKAVPSTDTLVEYLESDGSDKVVFETTLWGDKSPIKIISEDYDYINFDKKFLFKKEELKPKISDEDWQIKWNIDYIPQGVMDQTDKVYINDTLAENINLRLDNKKNLIINDTNFELYEAKLKPGTKEIDETTLTKVDGYLNSNTLTYNNDTRTMELTVPDKSKNYRFKYMTDMKKDINVTNTMNIAYIKGTIFKLKPVGKRLEISEVKVNSKTTIPVGVRVNWEAYDGDNEAFKGRHENDIFKVGLFKANEDTKKALEFTTKKLEDKFNGVSVEWDSEGNLIDYNIKMENAVTAKDYTTYIDGNVLSGFIITNKEKEPDKIDISVIKKWVGEVGSKIILKLTGNGKTIEKEIGSSSAVVGDPNTWQTSFEKLDKYEKDRKTPIKYTLTEEPLEGYTTVVTGDMEKGFVITNTKIGTTPGKPKPSVDPEPQKPEDKTPDEPKPPVTPEETKPEVKPEPTPQPQPEPKPNPQPNNPRPAYERNNVPDPNDPNSPDEITLIDENGVPLGNYEKKTNPDGTVEYVIMDEDVPLTNMLPKTGGMGVYIFIALGLGVSLAGLLLMRRKD